MKKILSLMIIAAAILPCLAAQFHAWRDVDLAGSGPAGDTMQIMVSFYVEGDYDTVFIVDTTFDTTEIPVDVVLLLDNSGSMRQEVVDAQNAAEAFINTLDDNDQVAAITYSTASRIDTVAPMTDTSGFADAISAIKANLDADGGYTAVWYSTKCAIDYLLANTRDGTTPVVIVLTDGEDNASDDAGMGATSEDAYDSLMRFIGPIADQITLFTISLGDSTNTSELQSLATATGGTYYLAGTSSELTAIYEAISDNLVNQTVDTTQSVTPVMVRQDTIGTFADALLLLDNSGSMKDEIGESKKASTEFINSLGNGDRVAAITYSTGTNVDTIVPFTGQSGFSNAITIINSNLVGSGVVAVSSDEQFAKRCRAGGDSAHRRIRQCER
jgi:Mg-chelatase subunit ChlD